MDNFVKYPRTLHLPHSLGKTDDDKTLSNTDHFKNKEVVVTLKMDGENTSIYHNGSHARSLTSSYHESRTWIKNLQGVIAHKLKQDERICGENMFARHSIEYSDLSSYFLMFSFWVNNLCLSWKETEAKAKELCLDTVPVIYQGVYHQKAIDQAFKPFSKAHEGYVVRLASSFEYNTFALSIAKFVRKGHVQTDKHWAHQAIVKNQLKKS
jgi:hypothetical protein